MYSRTRKPLNHSRRPHPAKAFRTLANIRRLTRCPVKLTLSRLRRHQRSTALAASKSARIASNVMRSRSMLVGRHDEADKTTVSKIEAVSAAPEEETAHPASAR